jgi:hypothetical protein
VGSADLLVIERASLLIDDLGADLDRELNRETREAERLRMLRETTNRITRTANDAIQAYRRAVRAVNAERERNDHDDEATLAMSGRLQAARLDLLRAIEAANGRYPWAGDERQAPSSNGAVDGS